MVNDPMTNFEIPTEMRQVAEKSLEDAKKAFDGFIAAAQKAAAEIEEQATLAQAGAKDVGRKAMAFAEQNVGTSFEFAQKLARAKTVEEMMRLQAEFVKTQMPVLSDQAKELGEAATTAPQRRPSRRTKRALSTTHPPRGLRRACVRPGALPEWSSGCPLAPFYTYTEHRQGGLDAGKFIGNPAPGLSCATAPVPVHHRLRLLAFPMRTADANS